LTKNVFVVFVHRKWFAFTTMLLQYCRLQRIRGFGDYALYKSKFYLLTYLQ